MLSVAASPSQPMRRSASALVLGMSGMSRCAVMRMHSSRFQITLASSPAFAGSLASVHGSEFSM